MYVFIFARQIEENMHFPVYFSDGRVFVSGATEKLWESDLQFPDIIYIANVSDFI